MHLDELTAPLTPDAEIAALRAALWECYVLAGGDAQAHPLASLDSAELGPLVVDCVRDLRGFFDALRRDGRSSGAR